jgi:hypothetical protein
MKNILLASVLTLGMAGLPALAAESTAPAAGKPAATADAGSAAKPEPMPMKVASRKKTTHRHRHHPRKHTTGKAAANKPAAATK